jgi:hypothetical protein
MSTSTYGFKLLAGMLKDIIFFPVWWYSFGFIEVLKKIKDFLADREKGLALFVWIKNIFTPMYGQYDIQGRLISFFVRVAQIIFRGVVMIFWLVVAFVTLLLWITSPFFVIYQIIYQII